MILPFFLGGRYGLIKAYVIDGIAPMLISNNAHETLELLPLLFRGAPHLDHRLQIVVVKLARAVGINPVELLKEWLHVLPTEQPEGEGAAPWPKSPGPRTLQY